MPKTTSEFNELVSNGTSVVDFFSDYCGPCKLMAPIFENLSNLHPKLRFISVDVDKMTEVAKAAEINLLPTFVIYFNGIIIDRFIGAQKEKFIEFIDSNAQYT